MHSANSGLRVSFAGRLFDVAVAGSSGSVVSSKGQRPLIQENPVLVMTPPVVGISKVSQSLAASACSGTDGFMRMTAWRDAVLGGQTQRTMIGRAGPSPVAMYLWPRKMEVTGQGPMMPGD